jgi:hypothetical protein
MTELPSSTKFLILFFHAFLLLVVRVHCEKVGEVIDSKPFCVGNEYITGKWLYNNATDLKKSFVCCAYNHVEKFYVKDVCFPILPKFNKTMLPTPKYHYTPNQGSNEFFMFPEGDGCTCDMSQHTSYSVTDRERYYWKPENCSLPQWNAKHFCQLLGSRNLLILGDSTGLQSFATLANMITTGEGGCATQLRYDWSNDLQPNPPPACAVCGSNDIYTSITTRPVIPDIVVILYGAHVPNLDYFRSAWVTVDRQLRQMHDLHPNMKFIYKSQNPAHVDCRDPHTKPSETIHVITKEDPNQWFWYLHDEFDRIAEAGVRKLQFFYHPEMNNVSHPHHHQHPQHKSSHFVPFIQYMDMTPLKYRVDAHTTRDCLHFCTPGPLDLFSVLLYNRLLNGEV